MLMANLKGLFELSKKLFTYLKSVIVLAEQEVVTALDYFPLPELLVLEFEGLTLDCTWLDLSSMTYQCLKML